MEYVMMEYIMMEHVMMEYVMMEYIMMEYIMMEHAMMEYVMMQGVAHIQPLHPLCWSPTPHIHGQPEVSKVYLDNLNLWDISKLTNHALIISKLRYS